MPIVSLSGVNQGRAFGLTQGVQDQMPSHLAVKVSFWGALEEVTIKKHSYFRF